MSKLSFYKGKKVLVTGHTGFKGSWMCRLLIELGADVIGYSLNPPTDPSMYNLVVKEDEISSEIGDIRDLDTLLRTFKKYSPEIVIHMAAQPLVRESYVNPVYTYDTNVMGTVNVLECVRLTDSVKSFVNVTTDKVYKNREWCWGYREDEELNGFDPYSNSKSCSELVTSSYKASFFTAGKDENASNIRKVAISTCRAGNVVGGGDFAKDRIIPDCVRAAQKQSPIVVRNPFSVRPYQHVLEPIVAYLYIAMRQYEDITKAGNYNIGPDEYDCLPTGDLVDLFCDCWNKINRTSIEWINKHDGGPHEAQFLKLDCSKIKNNLGWKTTWNMSKSMEKIIEWYSEYNNGMDVVAITKKQINSFLYDTSFDI